MLDKIKGLLSSIRFWMATLAAVSQIVKIYWPAGQPLLDIISLWFSTIFVAGSADSVANKIANR